MSSLTGLLRDKLQDMESELLDARIRIIELEEHFGNYRKSTMSDLQQISERVADMSRDLKLQKNETSGALRKLAQVESRLANSQSGFQEKINPMQQEMELMRQENSGFQAVMNDHKASQNMKNTAIFKEQRDKDGLQKAEAELVHNRSHNDEVRKEVSNHLEKSLVQENAQLQREISVLKTRVEALEQSEQRHVDRAANITVRYKQNDMNENEWMLVHDLNDRAKKAYERTLIEKDNEIKRKNNLIKQHEDKILQLETCLANRLREAPPSGSSRDNKQDVSSRNQHPALKPLSHLDSDIRVPVKRMMSLDGEVSTRPATRRKNK
ncbi:hypothetical protein BD769DRAFT_1683335 [Suillus cothurnatus]|nr:hypothetical protein BD769DRAFT_1683335 [Suillus cothurnatus]